MPELSFDINLGALFSPLLLIVLAYIVNTARKAVEHRVDERHEETTGHLKAIEVQTTATNGRVLVLEADHKADHDVLMTLKGSVDTLMGLRKGDAA